MYYKADHRQVLCFQRDGGGVTPTPPLRTAMMTVGWQILAEVTGPWAPIQQANFLTQVFIGC